jgi:predicted MFS family arabinose efflux permease
MGLVGFIFGTKYIGLLYGIVFLSHQVGSFLGAYLGGVFHDLYGSYDYAWYISIALSIFRRFDTFTNNRKTSSKNSNNLEN